MTTHERPNWLVSEEEVGSDEKAAPGMVGGVFISAVRIAGQKQIQQAAFLPLEPEDRKQLGRCGAQGCKGTPNRKIDLGAYLWIREDILGDHPAPGADSIFEAFKQKNEAISKGTKDAQGREPVFVVGKAEQ